MNAPPVDPKRRRESAWPPGPPSLPYDPRDPDAEVPAAAPRRKWPLVAGLVLAVAAAFFLRGRLVIRKLDVEGIRLVPWQQVARAAGLDKTVYSFAVNQARIAAGINSHPYLIFESLRTVFPDRMILTVRERRPSANVRYLGVSYVMAEDGVILEKGAADIYPLPVISGLALREIRVGAVPLSSKPDQLPACVALLEELHAQDWLSRIAEVDVSSPVSLYVSTRDGYTAHLGDAEALRAKIGTVRAVIEELERRGSGPGLIEAMIPGEAVFRPDRPQGFPAPEASGND